LATSGTDNFPLCESESCVVNRIDNSVKLRPAARPATVRAELTGSDACTALGITVQGYAPVLSLCCKLIEAGHDPARPLHVFRDDVLVLVVRDIGIGARLDINSKGTGFIARPAVRTASPVAWLAWGQA
jgi:hypothetical protein